MSYQAQTWVDKVGIHQCKNAGELLVLIRAANHMNGEMRGCYASGATIAAECLMGESTVLKHLRRLKAGGVLLPGDPDLVSHLRADKRPPVYDMAGGHESGCCGEHSSDLLCSTGARSEHPPKKTRATGARSEHPPKKPSSAGAQSEHPANEAPVTGVQIDLQRVFKSSTNSCKDLNSLFSVPAGAFAPQSSQQPQKREREAAAPEGDPTPAGDVVVMLVGLPGVMSEQAAVRLAPLVVAAVAAGWTLDRLRAHLARLCDPERVRYAPAVYEKHLRELPAPPSASGAGAGAGRASVPEGMCVRHPAFREGDCSPCRRAEMNRQARGRSEPGPVDGMGLLARVRAGMPAGGAQ